MSTVVILSLLVVLAIDVALARNPNSAWGIVSGVIYVLIGILLLLDAENRKAPTSMSWIILIGGCFWMLFHIVKVWRNRATPPPDPDLK